MVPTQTIVGPKGAVLEVFDPDTGEHVETLDLPPGVYAPNFMRSLTASGIWKTKLSGDVFELTRPSRGSIIKPKAGRYETAANPHFQPSDADRMARELERRLKRLEALERSAVKRLQIAERVANSGQAKPAPVDDGQVIEPVAEPAPAPAPAPAA